MSSACHERGPVRVRWSPRPDGLEESVQFAPGYNCPVPGGPGHGVHGMEVRWHLRGPAGAVVLTMGTDFIPGERRPGHGLSPGGLNENWAHWPCGMGIEYHARSPRYEGNEPEDGCDLLGAPCHWDMWYGGADDAVRRFVAEGEQVIWDALESAYASLQETEAASDG
jgi:hypothetical protein